MVLRCVVCCWCIHHDSNYYRSYPVLSIDSKPCISKNWLARKYRKKKTIVAESPDQIGTSSQDQVSKSTPKKKKAKTLYFGQDFRFHNHTMTNKGIDMREVSSSNKSTSIVHRAVVPTSPFISRRFYDWPPNPSLSKVSIYSE